MIRCSHNLVGSDSCKLKRINWEVSESGIVYKQMRQEGAETTPSKFPIFTDPEIQRKMILHFHQYNPTSVILTRKLHNSSEQVLKMLFNSEFGVYFSNSYQRIAQEVKRCMVCAITLQTVPIQPKGTRVAGVAF